MSQIDDLMREYSERRRRRRVFWSVVFFISLIGTFEHWQILEIDNCNAVVVDSRFWGLKSVVTKHCTVDDESKIQLSYHGGRYTSYYLKIYDENGLLFWNKYFASWDGGNEEKSKICFAISNGGKYRISTLASFVMFILCIASAFGLVIAFFTGNAHEEVG